MSINYKHYLKMHIAIPIILFLAISKVGIGRLKFAKQRNFKNFINHLC